MAMDYSKANGNRMLNTVTKKNKEMLNSSRVINIPLEQIDENPDNKSIFNMDLVDALAESIKEDGFSGAIEVFKKPDGRYEISAGHRRYKAMQLLGEETIPAIVSASVDNIAKAKKLLSSNINNRVLNPLDMANSINYYIENVLKPSGFKGNVREKCSEFFHKSGTQIYRYQAILKMIPELQEMSKNPMFPYTAFTSAATLTKEQQMKLYKEINDYIEQETEEGFEISRVRIEQMINNIRMKDNRDLERARELENSKSTNSINKPLNDIQHNDNIINPVNTESKVSSSSNDSYFEMLPDTPIVSSDEYVVYVDDILSTISNQLIEINKENYEIKNKEKVREYIDNIKREIKKIGSPE